MAEEEDKLPVTHREAMPGKTPGSAEGPEEENARAATACDPGKTPGSAEGTDGAFDDEPEERLLQLECPSTRS